MAWRLRSSLAARIAGGDAVSAVQHVAPPLGTSSIESTKNDALLAEAFDDGAIVNDLVVKRRRACRRASKRGSEACRCAHVDGRRKKPRWIGENDLHES